MDKKETESDVKKTWAEEYKKKQEQDRKKDWSDWQKLFEQQQFDAFVKERMRLSKETDKEKKQVLKINILLYNFSEIWKQRKRNQKGKRDIWKT